ncbi:hypothetical protein RJ639_006859 [Escallonia herrerae]|uniref:Photosystem II reaction center protein Z n=1 Tax=Escallonia herrerae TaxID=1293975 RepID=A0AA88VTL3_9ASTE|nr:hypothetical protein RJ639_006859 [Escallonia herrerae]
MLVSEIAFVHQPEEAEQFWFAFVLYSLKRLSERSADNANLETDENGFTLCQILRVAKLNIVEFFKELPQFIVKVGPIFSNLFGAEWEKRLEAKEMQANFVHLSLLSKYYKRAYREFFLTSAAIDDKQSAGVTGIDYVSDYHRFGWLLFLALRVHAFSHFKDLVTCTNGLVSILAILIIHAPSRFRNFTISDSPRFVKKNYKGVDLLASLCNMYETSEDELRKTMEKSNNLIADILKKKPCLASDCRAENLDSLNTDGLIYFEDLVDESSLSSSIAILEKDYDNAIRNKGGLDEKVFINEEDSLLGSSSLSGGAIDLSRTRKIDSITSPAKTITSPLSPSRSPLASQSNGTLGSGISKMAATPVSTAMTTAKWLRTIISPLPLKPSPELEKFLSSCDKDITADVICRARVIMEAIFPSSGLGERSGTGSLDNLWAEQRRLEALKLYYLVLQAMCTAEAQILHANNLTSLLTNERFHRCMLACSAELVLATHKTVTMLFPAVLERIGITAFDLSKVIESFIRHEDSLPRELRRHLNSLEERLLESMVWEKGSSIYNSLTVARSALSAEINRLGFLAEPMPSLDAIAIHVNMSCGGLPPVPSLHKHELYSGQNGDIWSPKRLCTEYRSALVERNSFTSPVKDRLLALNNLKAKLPPPALQSAFASPSRPNLGGEGEMCAETAISVFFGKIVKLAAVRINGMVERLQLSQQTRENVYCLFQQILSQQTALFFNRHIDQIILCCLYGVAKISQLNLTFREIIYNYRKQPQCKPLVFRTVFIDWSSARRNGKSGKDHVDIITFYNEIFIPAVKPLLVELVPAGAAQKNNQASEPNNNHVNVPDHPKKVLFQLAVFALIATSSILLIRVPVVFASPDGWSSNKNVVFSGATLWIGLVFLVGILNSLFNSGISRSSKSYYACVGESTHAYQSPSKDLTAINNRLNGFSTRKLRGTLNFDDADVGLVSDSLVANSLYLQNGSCASSSGALFKSEQPET